MRIDITGYVTEPLVSYSFAIKVTSDSVERLSRSNLQVSKEARIDIPTELYPFDDKFIELSGWDDPRRDKINECLSFGRALSRGDQIECSVFIVDPKTRAINRNRRDIETYADFDLDLWLYPDNGYFRRSESDSRESLKFRKQWRYTCINREKCVEITDYLLNNYRNKWWINKNPKMIFPILWWIRFKTAISKLSKKQNIVGIVGVVVSIISILVTIWLSRR